MRGVEVLDRIIQGVDPERNLALLEELCETMVNGSLCGLGGMTPFPVQSALRHFAADFTGAARH
jgi:formate dehydrogenase iron-sulfur subunit